MKLTWDGIGQKKYENGVSQGVLYRKNGTTPAKWIGVAWNGLTSVTESPEGADKTDLWADNIKYASMRAAETFGGTIEAYTYPPEFEACNGEAELGTGVVIGQQSREAFGLSYRTEQGNDETPNFGYKLHLVYNCTCSPSERAYETINDSPDAITLSWEFDSTPVAVTGHKPTSVMTIDSTRFKTEEEKAKLKALEDILYGTADADPYLPMPDEVLKLLNGENTENHTEEPKDPDENAEPANP